MKKTHVGPIRGRRNCEAILLWGKKHKYYGSYSFLTKELGIITCAIPHRRRQHMKHMSYLQPFSYVHMTISQEGEFYNLEQMDGVFLQQPKDLDHITAMSLASEMIQTLFIKEEVDVRLYQAVKGYAEIIRYKSPQLATIFLGYQLLSLAGMIPSAKAYGEGFGVAEFVGELERPLSDKALALIGEILKYNWSKEQEIRITKALWIEVEHALYSFLQNQLGEELKSLTFIKRLQQQ